MSRKTSIVVTMAVGMLIIPFTVQAEGDAARGQALYGSCQDCHGENGEGNHELNAPSLAGQYDWYLLSQMQNFRSGVRGQHPDDTFGLAMAEAAQTLTDDQAVEDVVAYITTLEPAQPTRTEMSGDPERGRGLFFKGPNCSKCHGAKAEGLPTEKTGDLPAPRLVGQYDWYLIRQTENFKDKVRGAHLDDKLGLRARIGILKLKKGQEVRDVVAYIMTLQ